METFCHTWRCAVYIVMKMMPQADRYYHCRRQLLLKNADILRMNNFHLGHYQQGFSKALNGVYSSSRKKDVDMVKQGN